MTNEEILKAPEALLTTIEKQKRFLLRLALIKVPCPVCGHAVNQLEAAGIGLEDYPFDDKKLDFRCRNPACGVPLREVVPWMGGASPWYWMRKFNDDERR